MTKQTNTREAMTILQTQKLLQSKQCNILKDKSTSSIELMNVDTLACNCSFVESFVSQTTTYKIRVISH